MTRTGPTAYASGDARHLFFKLEFGHGYHAGMNVIILARRQVTVPVMAPGLLRVPGPGSGSDGQSTKPRTQGRVNLNRLESIDPTRYSEPELRPAAATH